VIFADAVHPTHAVRPVGCWAPKEVSVALEQSSGRDCLNIHGAIDLETGETIMKDVLTVDAMSTIRLLMANEAMYPRMRWVHVFLDNEDRFLLSGTAHERCRERAVLGAAPVSTKRIGLNGAAKPPMGFAQRVPWTGTVACRRDEVPRMQDCMARNGSRTMQHAIDRQHNAVFEINALDDGEEYSARHELVAAASGVALLSSAAGWHRRLGHEVSRHMGWRGGGHGCSLP